MDKKYIKNVLIYVLTGILSILGIGYIVFHLTGGDSVAISTEVAILVQSEDRVQSQAIVFRDETAIEGSSDDVFSIVKDGTNVMAGAEVLHVFSAENNISDQLTDLEERIRVLKSSLGAQGIPTAHSSNEKKLGQLYRGMMTSVHGGSLADAEKTAIELQVCINLRKHSSVTQQSIKEAITRLEKQRDDLIASSAGTVYTAPVTGLYYQGSDGLEDLCTLETAKEMDYDTFVQLQDAVSQSDMTAGVGRIATDTYWYVAMTLKSEVARELQVGTKYPICFDENESLVVYMTLERMDARYKQSDCLVVFGSRTVPTDLCFERSQTVSLLTSGIEGIRVPIGAVRYLEGKVGVYVTEGNKVVFRRIDILAVGDGYYTVKQYDTSKEGYTDMIRLHDKIILTGKGLYHGKFLS